MTQRTARDVRAEAGSTLPPGKTLQHACQDAQETLREWKMRGQHLLPCVWKEVETLQELCAEMVASSGTESEDGEWLGTCVEEMEWTVGYVTVMIRLANQGALPQRTKEVAA